MAAPRHRPHNEQEFQKLLEWITGAESLLEIGSRFGYPLVDMAHVCKPGARIVSVDLPDAEGWYPPLNTLPHLRSNVEQLKNEGYDTHLIIGDSHDPVTVERVRALGPFDFVFIDGDHSYEGVKLDWENYGPMGKIVAFHDIRQPQGGENQAVQVWMLWEELKPQHDAEYLYNGSKMGIGRIVLE